ncbi:pilin [Thioflexithrix psekupsensis]|uniref:Prepilin-type N-terminal cleavage/methylation domain-containing protein n=1 Tax=Thioflexithrix psekupsensis TaxID=1570016 RepID=A0A251X4M1_9GAMM|nr:pilin [Thioflexithrix psekupsensis]OUD12371.1 hypothetical protein TPSD3_14770 [Thioflexithrix psekupsensis]
MKKQLGMSIIELMLVVLTISVLASIAIPLYTDYQRRSKVAEAMNLMAGLKLPMMDYYTTWGTWPTVEQVGGKTQGLYVESVVSGGTPGNYYVEATMGGADPDLGGHSLRMYYEQNTGSWLCTPDGATNPIPVHLLPSSCK